MPSVGKTLTFLFEEGKPIESWTSLVNVKELLPFEIEFFAKLSLPTVGTPVINLNKHATKQVDGVLNARDFIDRQLGLPTYCLFHW